MRAIGRRGPQPSKPEYIVMAVVTVITIYAIVVFNRLMRWRNFGDRGRPTPGHLRRPSWRRPVGYYRLGILLAGLEPAVRAGRSAWQK
jgi:hypothetical protein